MCSNPSVDVQSVPWFKHLDCLAGKVFKNNRQGLHLWEVPVMQQRPTYGKAELEINPKQLKDIQRFDKFHQLILI